MKAFFFETTSELWAPTLPTHCTHTRTCVRRRPSVCAHNVVPRSLTWDCARASVVARAPGATDRLRVRAGDWHHLSPPCADRARWCLDRPDLPAGDAWTSARAKAVVSRRRRRRRRAAAPGCAMRKTTTMAECAERREMWTLADIPNRTWNHRRCPVRARQ
jgi:hypothetical protein